MSETGTNRPESIVIINRRKSTKIRSRGRIGCNRSKRKSRGNWPLRFWRRNYELFVRLFLIDFIRGNKEFYDTKICIIYQISF
jgi:hypothetical protein